MKIGPASEGEPQKNGSSGSTQIMSQYNTFMKTGESKLLEWGCQDEYGSWRPVKWRLNEDAPEEESCGDVIRWLKQRSRE